MPTFELVLLVRKLERSHLKEVLKRSAGYIFDAGGTLRNMENLGLRNLPFVINSKGKRHIHAHCFVLNFDAAFTSPTDIQEKFKIDLDVIRSTHWLRSRTVLELHTGKKPPECTMHLDLLPAPYRPNVIALQEMAKKKEKKRTHKEYEDTDFLLF